MDQETLDRLFPEVEEHFHEVPAEDRPGNTILPGSASPFANIFPAARLFAVAHYPRSRMDRRLFLQGSLSMAIVMPPYAEAQRGAKLYRVASLSVSPREVAGHVITALEQRLRELGYVEGENVQFEHRFAGGEIGRLPALAAELVRLKVDVIVVAPNPSIAAAKQATNTIPIVTTYASDPVGAGFAVSLAHPGGNVTGLTADVTAETWGIRLQLLREVNPKMSRVAVLWNPDIPGAAAAWRATVDAARRFAITLRPHETRHPDDFAPAFDVIRTEVVEAILVITQDGTTYAKRREINDFAAGRRLPTMYGFREGPDDGGLMSYGLNIAASYRRAATFVDKLLKGAKAGDLPIERPAKLELVINLKTAKALQLTIPPALLVRADEVIQ